MDPKSHDSYQPVRVVMNLAMNNAARAEQKACLAIVRAEPEFPGPPPLSNRLFVMAFPARAMRQAVRATKRNIAAAIEEQMEAGDDR
jgi:hypothetical protein